MEFFLLPFVLRPHPNVQKYTGGHQGAMLRILGLLY